MNKQNRVCLKDGLIQFDSSNQSDWSLDVGKIRVVIEYTTEEGPFVPDHFLVFVDCSATVPMQRKTHCTEHQQQAQARKKSRHFGVAAFKGELG